MIDNLLPTPDDAGDSCEAHIIHAAAVRQARAEQSAPATIKGLAALFGALSDPTRLWLIEALARREMCVYDLAAVAGVSRSAVSHQLRLLRDLGLVRGRRAGKIIYYALDDHHVATIFRQGLDHVAHGLAGQRAWQAPA